MKKLKSLLKKVKISSCFIYLFWIISLVLLFLTCYVKSNFYGVTVDQLIYSMYNAEGTSESVITNGIIYVIPRVLITFVICLIIKFIWIRIRKVTLYFIFKIRNKSFKFCLSPLTTRSKVIISIILLIVMIYYPCSQFGLIDYLDPRQESTYIEENYVDPKEVSITAPSEKQNLIYIYVESLETSFLSSENGGNFKKSVIPNLEKLAKNNISFSNSTKLGGAYTPYGTGWTIAGMVGSTAGVPLKWLFGANTYSGVGAFLPGSYNLGDVLKDNGYNNYLFIGSDAAFGGRKDYFTYHGNYTIYDYNSAIKDEWIDDDYYVWWGYEDKKLFDFAKNTLTDISNDDEPFNFTMLTADTHFVDGYVDETCKQPYEHKYLNSYYCSDSMLGEFIDWIKKQDFYKDTTIVIVGDHVSMQENLNEMFDVKKEDERVVYNVYINSRVNTDNTKNREFTTLDFYPTTLAALGFKIEGNRLGLGTNLFSSKKTLVEESDYKTVNAELTKRSVFYNDKLLDVNNK